LTDVLANITALGISVLLWNFGPVLSNFHILLPATWKIAELKSISMSLPAIHGNGFELWQRVWKIDYPLASYAEIIQSYHPLAD
jgi:hypothetical protein